MFLRSPVYVLGTEVIEWCLEGVCRVSGWCLTYLGYCQDCIDGKPIEKKTVLYYYFQLLSFTVPTLIDFTVGGKCQEGVWALLG